MSEWRRTKSLGRRDASEPEIVEAFLAGDASVAKHSNEDEGDLIVGYRGVDHWIENKTGNAKLKPGQVKWAAEWKGRKPEVCRNGAQARKLLAIWDLEFAEQQQRQPTIEEDLAKGVA